MNDKNAAKANSSVAANRPWYWTPACRGWGSGVVGLILGLAVGLSIVFFWMISIVDVATVENKDVNATITMQVKDGIVDPDSVMIEMNGQMIKPMPVERLEGNMVGRATIGANVQIHRNPWTCTVWNGSMWVQVTYFHPC